MKSQPVSLVLMAPLIHQRIHTMSVRQSILPFFFFQALKVVARNQTKSTKLKREKRGIFASGSAAASDGLAAARSIDSNENAGAPPKPAAGFNLLRHDSILPQITRLPRGAETGAHIRGSFDAPHANKRSFFGKHTQGAFWSVAKGGVTRRRQNI